MTAQSTATALLDAAEIAFTRSGFDNASLRGIMRDAGANAAAVHYHYGSRQALAEAVLDRALVPLQTRRIELLDIVLAANGSQPSLAELLAALLRPDFEMAADTTDRNPGAASLVGAIYIHPSRFVKTLVEGRFGPVADRFMPYFQLALPHLDRSELAWRVRWIVFGTLGARLSDADPPMNRNDLDAELALMINATSGALLAPATTEQHQ